MIIRRPASPWIALFTCALGLGSAALGQGKINWPRMERDLDIMETILNRLLNPERAEIQFEGARALYFAGYGVVFQVEVEEHAFSLFQYYDWQGDRVSPENVDENKLVVVGGKVRKSKDLDLEKQIREIEDRCFAFLRDYADAIGQLKPEDRITVLVDFGNAPRLGFWRVAPEPKTVRPFPANLQVTALKRDIVAHRRGKLSEEAFRKRVVTKHHIPEASRDRSIDIMANILNTALNRERIGAGAAKRGLHLEGLGALFFLNTELLDPREHSELSRVTRMLDEMRVLQESMKEQKGQVNVTLPRRAAGQKEAQSALERLKAELVELVADYGHTLRTLEPNEYVVVSVDFRNSWAYVYSETPSRIVLKVKKSELDRYERGDLTFAQLRQEVKFVETRR